MKTRTSRPFRSVLVPLDGSPLAEQAIPLALAIARLARSKVRLVLVHHRLPPPFYEESAKLYVSIDLAIRKAGRDYLRGSPAACVSARACGSPQWPSTGRRRKRW
jgi:nucleotide-binding universal stress UspA family protein